MSVEIRTGLISSQNHSVLQLIASNGQGLYIPKGIFFKCYAINYNKKMLLTV